MGKIIDCLIAIAGAAIGYVFGGIPETFDVLVILVILDYISGVFLAIIEKKLNSDIGISGIFKKFMIFLIVGMAHVLDSKIFNTGYVLCMATLFLFIANEGVSLLENAKKAGLPIPQKLADALAKIKIDGCKK